MAVSAFRSRSKRSTSVAPPPTSSSKSGSGNAPEKRPPPRRARSVSVAPRSGSADNGGMEFMNKRDNPLFSCSSPSSASSLDSDARGGVCEEKRCDFDGRRGRSMWRSSGDRSSSTVDNGRRRQSVSRSHYGDFKEKNEIVLKNSGELEERRNFHTWTSRHPLPDHWETSSSYERSRNWEDGISTTSHLEAEEVAHRKYHLSNHSFKSIGESGIYEAVRSEVQRAVSEIRYDLESAIRQKNHTIVKSESTVGDPSKLDNQDTAELLSDIQKEYATKLEQSKERARKLRADLALEEQCGDELSKILKQMCPETNRSSACKSRQRRKTSIERLRMSRRLTEEALSYFDECVSLSTFDSSDFSSIEEPPPISVVGAPHASASRFFSNESPGSSILNFRHGYNHHHEESDDQTQCSLSLGESDFGPSGNCSIGKIDNPMLASGSQSDLVDFVKSGRSSQSSFAQEIIEPASIQDISHYIEKFNKEPRRGVNCVKARSSYSVDDYNLETSAESLLFDKVMFKNRIDTGGLLICDIRIF